MGLEPDGSFLQESLQRLTQTVTEPETAELVGQCRPAQPRPEHGGLGIAPSTIYRLLRRPASGLQSRWERLAVLEAHRAQAAGSLTEHARRKVGRCSAPPGAVRSAEGARGELVCLHTFYIGKLKGVGRVWQPVLADRAGIHWLRCGLLL